MLGSARRVRTALVLALIMDSKVSCKVQEQHRIIPSAVESRAK